MPSDNELRVARVVERQRAARDTLLASLPDDVVAVLAKAPTVYFPGGAEIRAHGFVSRSGVGSEDCRVPEGYRYREFGWREKALATVASFPPVHDDEPAHLWPLGVDAERRSLPLFDVEFGRARGVLGGLLIRARHGFALLTATFEAGIVLSIVGGYLPHDHNPAEIIFELGTWSPHDIATD